MKKHTKEEALKIITDSATEYNKALNGFHFLIIYQKKNTSKGEEDVGFYRVGFRSRAV